MKKCKRKNGNQKKVRNSKNSIYMNGKRYFVPQALDEENGTIKKQVFDKNKGKATNQKNPCKKCENNENGFCTKYKKWCNLAKENCGGSYQIYVYKDKNHNLHTIKY